MLRPYLDRLWSLLRGERELDEELRFHLDKQTEANIAAGMAPGEARRQALVALGGIDKTREEYRDALGLRMLEDLIRDLRYGLRQLRRSPGFTAVAVTTLALGIGANTAIFSVINAVLIRPLPFRDPERLMRVYERDKGPTQRELQPHRSNLISTSLPGFLEWRARTELFEAVGASRFFPVSLVLTTHDGARELSGTRVTANFFSVLGVQPALGRTFAAEEEKPGRGAVAILSDHAWREHFGADASVTGRAVTMNGRSYTIIGVMPAYFHYPQQQDVWIPIEVNDDQVRSFVQSGGAGQRGSRNLEVIARLKTDVPIVQVETVLRSLAQVNAREYPASNKGWDVAILPLREELVGKSRRGLLLLFGATAFITLIACANVANLLLARAATRRREMAVRAAVGAARTRLLRQALAEAAILALLAAAVGLAAGWWSLRSIVALAAGNVPQLDRPQLDWRVLCFSFAAAALACLLSAAASAAQAYRTAPGAGLKEGGTAAGSSRLTASFRATLVVVELALALVLLAGAGLMMNTLARLYAVELGFLPQRLLTARVPLPSYKYSASGGFDQAHARAFASDVVGRVESLPGVASAAFVYPLPFSGEQEGTNFEIEGREHGLLLTHIRVATPHYFQTLRIPVVRGRFFTAADGPEAPPVVLINETIARRMWPNEDPVGRRVRVKNAVREIVGVVGGVRHLGLDHEPGAEMYLPYAQYAVYSRLFLAVRAHGELPALAAALRREVMAADKDQPVEDIQSMDELIAGNAAPRRFYAMLFGIFAGVALALAAAGVYGTTSYWVSQRTHEIGIRVAMGARPADIYALLLGRQLRATLLGAVLGLSAAIALARLLGSLLFGVAPADPMTLAVATLLLAGVALFACYIPARRAARVDPVVALRCE
jgi:putative ABC transport system permease protein